MILLFEKLFLSTITQVGSEKLGQIRHKNKIVMGQQNFSKLMGMLWEAPCRNTPGN